MRIKFAKVYCIAAMLLVIACSSADDKMLRGKWKLSGRMIGGAPSSFWFKGGGTVIAPWEAHNFALQSEGKYVLTEKSRIKIMMNSGYYQGNTYLFDIKKIDEHELILMNNYQDIKLKKSEDSEPQK